MTDLNQRPLIHRHNPELGGHNDPRFRGIKFDVPAKLITNTRGNMDLQDLYSRGPLKFENTGPVCQTCLNFYPDPKIEKTGMGRCKARGFLRVHQDTPATDRPKGWSDPSTGISFPFWPSCPLYSESLRMSRK
jgi:hypothetical protein